MPGKGIRILFLFFFIVSCEENKFSDSRTNEQNNTIQTTVTKVYPANGAENVSCDTEIVISFNTDLDQDFSGEIFLGPEVFRSSQNADFIVTENYIRIIPHSPLRADTQFKRLQVSGVTDSEHKAIDDFSDEAYSFTTSADNGMSDDDNTYQPVMPAQTHSDNSQTVRINEFMPGDNESASNEFIELYNAGESIAPLDSSDKESDYSIYRFTNSAWSRTDWELVVSFDKSSLSIAPGSFLLAGAGGYGTVSSLSYPPSLSGTSGGIALVRGSRSEGEIIDILCYDTNDTWNNTAFCEWEIDGTEMSGSSYIRTNDNGTSGNTADLWSLSPRPTPGKTNITALDFRLINCCIENHNAHIETQINRDSSLYYLFVKNSRQPSADNILQGNDSTGKPANHYGLETLVNGINHYDIAHSLAPGIYQFYLLAFDNTNKLCSNTVFAGSFDVETGTVSVFETCYTFENNSCESTMLRGLDNSSQIFCCKGRQSFPEGHDSVFSYSTDHWRDSDANYIEICLCAVNKSISLQTICFDHIASSTGPVSYGIYSSVDSFTNSLASGTVNKDQHFTEAFHSLNITGKDNIIIRIYAMGATSFGGCWKLDNLRFEGTVETL